MKTPQKSLKLNFIMNATLTMSSFIFPLITFPYVSRILLPEGTGKVAFAVSLISYFSMFAQLGIPSYGIRACAKVRDNKEELTRTAHELLFINLIMSLISYLALALALLFVPRLQDDKTLYIIISFSILLTSIGMEWLYKALEQYSYITIRSIIFKFVALIMMFILIHEQEDYVIYGGITIFAASASNLLNFFNARKYIDMELVGNYNVTRHLKAVGIFFAMSCATVVYTNMDTIMLGFISGNEEVGYYNAAIKIKYILLSIVTSFGSVLLPRSSYYIEHGMRDKFDDITKKALNFVFLIAAPIMLYFIIYGKQGIYFLSGDAYTNSIIPMQIIMPTVLIIGITNILGIQILVPLGREKTVLYSVIAGAVTNVIVNALSIPAFASSGAAIGTLIAELVVLLVQLIALKSEVLDAFHAIAYWKIVLGLCLAILGSYWLTFSDYGNFLTLVLTAMTFFILYGGTLLISKETLTVEIFKQVRSKFTRKK